jgi:zinc protease
VREPRFPADELLRERRRVLEELDARKDNPGYLAFRLFTQALYSSHPYRLDVLGTRASIGRLPRKRIAEFYASRYPVGALTLAVVGDVEPARVLRRVRSAFGDAPATRPLRTEVARERFKGGGPHELYQFLDRQQAHLVVGFPGTTVDDADRYLLEVLMAVLSGQGGRLFLELRDRQSLAYRVAAFSVEGIDPGYVAVYIACSPDKLDAAYAGIRAELARLVDVPPQPEEVTRAVRYLVGTHDISLQRRASVASAIAFHEAYGLGHDEYRRYASAVEAVTPADVQRVAREYFDWDTAVIATVRPEVMSPEAERRARGKRSRRTPGRKAAP